MEQIRNPRSQYWCLARIGLVALIFAHTLMGCASDRTTNPDPFVRSRVYYTQANPPVLFIFDGDGDTLIDTLSLPREWGTPQVSADALTPRIVVSSGGEIMLLSADAPAAGSLDSVPSAAFAFTHDPDLIFGSRGGRGCVVAGELALYRTPDFLVEHHDTLGLRRLETDYGHHVVFGVSYTCSPAGSIQSSSLGAYDYVDYVARVWSIGPSPGGPAYRLLRFHLHPQGRRVYATAEGSSGHRLLCYNIEDSILEFDIPLTGDGGEPRVSPDGAEIWYPDMGLGSPPYPEVIRIYSAESGNEIGVIPLTAYRVEGRYPVLPMMIRFLPSGDKAYVACGSDLPGPLLVVDVHKREVIQAFFENEQRPPGDLDLGPAP